VACGSLGVGLAFAAAGDLDTSFDTDGVARTDLTGNSQANDIAVQPDGKIVAAGNSNTSSDDLPALARYLTTGALDTASFGAGTGTVEITPPDPETIPVHAVAVRPTGQIVIAGSFDGTPAQPAQTMAVGQLTAAGAVDGNNFSFPFGFKQVVFSGNGAAANDLALESDGDAVAAGFAVSANAERNFAAARFSPNGQTVTTFGPFGIANIAFGNVLGDDEAQAIAIDPADGGILLAGNADPTSGNGGTNDDNDIAVVRLTPAGALEDGGDGPGGDGWGGGDGVVTIDIGRNDTAADIAIQPDRKIAVAGTSQPTGGGAGFDHFVLRLAINGGIDSGFGGGGSGVFVQSAVSNPNAGRALALLPDGRIVVGGETIAGLADWVVARYTSAGLPDTSFDGDGSRTYSFPGEVASLTSLALQPDGKVVIGGSISDGTEGDFAIGRLLADDLPPVVTPPAALAPTPTPSGGGAAKKRCKKGKKGAAAKKCKKKRK
jgi:uncharacterized delta-60 repeat protein